MKGAGGDQIGILKVRGCDLGRASLWIMLKPSPRRKGLVFGAALLFTATPAPTEDMQGEPCFATPLRLPGGFLGPIADGGCLVVDRQWTRSHSRAQPAVSALLCRKSVVGGPLSLTVRLGSCNPIVGENS